MVGRILIFSAIYTTSVDIDHLNKNKSAEDMLPDTPGLYDKYVDWGIISEDQQSGGLLTNFKSWCSLRIHVIMSQTQCVEYGLK